MKVGLWATHDHQYMPLLVYTLEKGKIPFEISEHQHWVQGKGWEMRCRWERDWCSRQGREQVMLLDAWDSVVLCHLGVLQDRIDCLINRDDILWSAESVCWPSPERASLFPATPFKYRYPNGGAIVGPGERLAELFNQAVFEPNYDMRDVFHPDGNQPWMDQVFFQDLYLAGHGKLDARCEVFQNMINETESNFKKVGRWVENVTTEEWPLIFHANGHSRFPRALVKVLEETL